LIERKGEEPNLTEEDFVSRPEDPCCAVSAKAARLRTLSGELSELADELEADAHPEFDDGSGKRQAEA
jgi:hypothetical protein